MVDLRIKKLAKILVDWSICVKKGEIVEISSAPEAKELVSELYKLILEKGAHPRTKISLPGLGYFFYKKADDEQLKHFPKIAMYEAKNTDAFISIGAAVNTKELTNINPKRISVRRKTIKPISDTIIKKDRWVIFEYPTNALAQDAEMSLSEFEDFVFKSCIKDWRDISKKQDKIKKMFDKGKEVRILSKDTDICFSIEGREAIKCDGKRNMPDGEVFMAPVDDSAEGYIKYSYPAIYGGREVDGIYLEFKKGRVVKAKAKKGEKFLKEMVATDKGSCRLGEFGIGLNYDIKKFVKQILFDEKIGGTIHLALGMAYPEGGGINKSAIHWDMIKDLRKDGVLFVDGKCVQKKGKWIKL